MAGGIRVRNLYSVMIDRTIIMDSGLKFLADQMPKTVKSVTYSEAQAIGDAIVVKFKDGRQRTFQLYWSLDIDGLKSQFSEIAKACQPVPGRAQASVRPQRRGPERLRPI